MIRDYEIIDSENGIVRETKELIKVDSLNGVYINPESETYNALLNLFESIKELVEVLTNEKSRKQNGK